MFTWVVTLLRKFPFVPEVNFTLRRFQMRPGHYNNFVRLYYKAFSFNNSLNKQNLPVNPLLYFLVLKILHVQKLMKKAYLSPTNNSDLKIRGRDDLGRLTGSKF